MNSLSSPTPYVLLLLGLLASFTVRGQQKDSEKTTAPGTYWVALGEDLVAAFDLGLAGVSSSTMNNDLRFFNILDYLPL